MTRKLAAGAALIVAAILLYGAAGYWLAPRLLLDALQTRAAPLGTTLRVADVRAQPFALEVKLQGVELLGADGERLAAAREVHVDLAWASLWRSAWIVQEASIVEPAVLVALGPGGELNWPLQRGDPGGTGETSAVLVQALSIMQGTVRVLDRSRGRTVEAALQDIAVEAHNVATHQGEAPYRLSARLSTGGSVQSQGTFSLAPLAAHGRIELAGVALEPLWTVAVAAGKPAQGALDATASYAYEKGALVLADVYAEATDVRHAGVHASKITLETRQVAIPPVGAVPLSAQVELSPRGSVSAKGTVELSEAKAFVVDLRLDASGIPLALAQRFLAPAVAVRIDSGLLSANGTVQGDTRSLRFSGAAELEALRVVERDSGQLLLGWKQARTEALELKLPGHVEVGEAWVRAPHARIAVESEGRLNLAQAFKGGGGGDGAPLRAVMRRLRVEDGTLDFADRSLDTPFEIRVRQLTGTVTGFSTQPGDPALVGLTGRVGEYGSAKIRGTIDFDQPKALADITAQLRNVGLAQLTPYVVKFAGYRVQSGRLDANLRYRVRDARLVGDNQLVFRSLELGEKVERAGTKELPLELAVALLSDAEGRITLDIPVRGNLNDPQFDFGGLVARAVGNVIGKIVSAPFRALAAVLGGKQPEDLGEARFDPGSATLSPPQEESVAKMAKALAERPQLGIVVRAGYDPAHDTAALSREAARRAVAKRAGYASAGPLDFTEPKTLQAAENLYLDRVGNRLELQALRAREPRYGRALVEALAQTMATDAAAPQSLARERAEAVRSLLLKQGVELARVAIEAPQARNATDEGVATQLGLTAHTGPAPAEPAQTALVREMQRQLEAAGFDPGPVDGRFGPLTERALRRFQQARRLPASGELDASTRAALGLNYGASTGSSAR